MADNDDNDEAAVAENDEEEVSLVETKIERTKSDNPKERLYKITFNDFEDLPSEKGRMVRSSKFSCFGSKWRVGICPGGHTDSSDGMVGAFLERRSSRRSGRNLALIISFELCSFDGIDRFSRKVTKNFDGDSKYSDLFDVCLRKEITGSDGDDEEEEGFLVKGALTILVSMQLDQFIPKNPTSSVILKLFDDENSADVEFEICEQQKSESESDRKRAKTSTDKIYHAHRLILQHYSPELSALCATSDEMSPIVITDVKPEVFRLLLYYVYGGKIRHKEFEGNEKDFIAAADKYGVTNLKLEAEIWYVNNTGITIENVIDNLLYADAFNCALLKETVIDFIVENKEKVMQRVSFQDVPGDVCKDFLAAMSRHYDSSSDDDDDGDRGGDETDVEKTYSKMTIRDLREKLNDKGLDIDGSREALIASLMEHS